MSLTRGPATVCARIDFELFLTGLGEGIACVRVTGEVDLLAAPVSRQSLMDVVDAGGRRVVVDFSEATFVDSTVLGVLVGANKRLREQDGLMVIVCGSPNIRTIFEITLLDRCVRHRRFERRCVVARSKVRGRHCGRRFRFDRLASHFVRERHSTCRRDGSSFRTGPINLSAASAGGGFRDPMPVPGPRSTVTTRTGDSYDDG